MQIKSVKNSNYIISLTSWKKRISTTHLTILSIYKMCPGAHIVLVLSTDEFPMREKELPKTLLDTGVEILWVKENYKNFKKVLFTIEKYNNLPVISADDGCIYLTNFAEPLYEKHLKEPNKIIAYNHWFIDGVTFSSGGYGVLFPPNCFGTTGTEILKKYKDKILENGNDDLFIGCLAKIMNLEYFCFMKLYERKTGIFENIEECQTYSLTLNKQYKNEVSDIYKYLIKTYKK